MRRAHHQRHSERLRHAVISRRMGVQARTVPQWNVTPEDLNYAVPTDGITYVPPHSIGDLNAMVATGIGSNGRTFIPIWIESLANDAAQNDGLSVERPMPRGIPIVCRAKPIRLPPAADTWFAPILQDFMSAVLFKVSRVQGDMSWLEDVDGARECVICAERILAGTASAPCQTCKHTDVHETCRSKWGRGCPLCRGA